MNWRDRWLDLRDRLLIDARFQRLSLAFPLTRPIVRRWTRQLFDLVAGFAYSQVLHVCVQLKLFDHVAGTPLSTIEIARRIGWDEDHTERLLKAAAALGLLQRRSDGRYGLGPHGAALAGNPWIAKFILHHDLFYRDLVDPVALLRGDGAETELRKYWAYARAAAPDALPAQATAAYTALMAASQQAVAAEVLDAYDFGRHRTLLDVGGGDGSFIAAVAARHPKLQLVLFDLPGVVVQATVQYRARVVGGDFLADPLPEGADIVTLVRIVHDHDDDAVRTLLAAVRRVLPSDGCLVVAESLSGVRGTESVTDAYFNLYFAAMGSGRTRTAEAIGKLGQEAGFARFRALRTRNPLIAGIIVLTP